MKILIESFTEYFDHQTINDNRYAMQDINLVAEVKSNALTKPEEGCGQEVPAVVCFQPEDAQLGAHKQFDSRPEQYPVPIFLKKRISTNYV